MWIARLTPRPWQAEALKAWSREHRGIVRVVTGAGKTYLALLCMQEFRQRNADGRIVVVVPTTALLDQWYVSLREDLGIVSDDIACYSGREHPSRAGLVNVAVINTARHVGASLADGSRPAMLIVDECHRAGSPANALALRGDYVAALGLSATPERQYDDGFETIIAPSLGRVVYEYGYEAAYRDGAIAPFDLVNVQAEFLDSEQEEYDRLTRLAAMQIRRTPETDSSRERLRRLLLRRAAVTAMARMRIPVAARLVDSHRHERLIVFHERVEDANKLAAVIGSRGHRVTIYHSLLGPHVRRDNLRLYRDGCFDVLVTCRALDEGLNVPDTSVAVIASSTASRRQRIQRMGRVLRPSPGKERATVYTLYTSRHEQIRLSDEALRIGEVASVTWLRATRSAQPCAC